MMQQLTWTLRIIEAGFWVWTALETLIVSPFAN